VKKERAFKTGYLAGRIFESNTGFYGCGFCADGTAWSKRSAGQARSACAGPAFSR